MAFKRTGAFHQNSHGFQVFQIAKVVLLLLVAQLAHGHDAAEVTKDETQQNAEIVRTIPLLKQYVPVNQKNKTIAYKTAYFGEIQAGTPAQTFTVVFDTGSGHVLLPRTSCRTETCEKHRRFDSKESSTAVDIEHNGNPLSATAKERDQVVISFGTGKVTGEFVEDRVCIGSPEASCTKTRVVVATDMTPDPFGLFAFDGVMGLSLDALRLNPKFSFFGQMIAQHPGMLPQFSAYLSRYEDGVSTITFGGFDKEKTTSDIVWAPVAMANLGFWQVQIKEVRIGDTILEECADGSCRAVLDTGTSLLGVPRPALRALHRHLARPAPNEGVDCRQVPGHSFDFDLGDTVISLPVEDYSRPQPIKMLSQVNGTNSTSLLCRSLLLPIDMAPPIGPKVFIWGEPVLRRYLTVYDVDQKRVGFSLARQPDGPSGGPARSIGAPKEGSLLAGAPLPGAVGQRKDSETAAVSV